MNRIEGQPCPHCGSKRQTLLEQGRRLGRITQRLRCHHCGKTFRAWIEDEPEPEKPDPVPIYTPRPVKCRCPKCDAPNPKVITTQKKVRHHRCECGCRFKSVEQS